MGIGPVPATAKALSVAGLTRADSDLIELNEAFAAQVLACAGEWEFTDADFDRANVNGSGISPGHPVGATGGRILATLSREMVRRDARYGLETMCIGGGQGLAARLRQGLRCTTDSQPIPSHIRSVGPIAGEYVPRGLQDPVQDR
jgi:acetyl-CoA C-acetyltransferase